jgi:hypothetical protein
MIRAALKHGGQKPPDHVKLLTGPFNIAYSLHIRVAQIPEEVFVVRKDLV